MKRIISACLEQTIRFDRNNGTNPQEDYEIYLKKLERKNTKYKVMDTQKEDDGSLIIKIKKQHNTYSTEGYFEK